MIQNEISYDFESFLWGENFWGGGVNFSAPPCKYHVSSNYDIQTFLIKESFYKNV